MGCGFGSVLLIGAIKARLSSEFALRFETLLAPTFWSGHFHGKKKAHIFKDVGAFSALFAHFVTSGARGSFDRPSDSEKRARWAWGV